MTMDRSAAGAIWSVLTAGAGLACLGLFRDARRFRQWRKIRHEQEGEIVLGDRALRVGQAVQISVNGDEKRFATICAIEKKTLRLRLERQPAGAKAAVTPTRSAMVTLIVTGDGALFRFTAQVTDAAPCSAERGECLLAVKRPAWLARIQRRHHVRASFALPATFEFTEPTNRDAERVARHGTVLNLSAGGFCADIGGPHGLREAAELLQRFAPGTVLRVRLPIPALTDPLLARIRLSERVAVRGGLSVRVACEFLPMPVWEQELIVQHIFQSQREQARKKKIQAEPKTTTERGNSPFAPRR